MNRAFNAPIFFNKKCSLSWICFVSLAFETACSQNGQQRQVGYQKVKSQANNTLRLLLENPAYTQKIVTSGSKESASQIIEV